MKYPSGFSQEPYVVTADHAGNSTDSLAALAAKDFRISIGLRRSEMSLIQAIATQPAVREYCPEDVSRRFADETAFQAWLESPGGRAFFTLRHSDKNVIAGYGWTRPKQTDVLPDYYSTIGIRISHDFSGQGLGVPFTSVMLDVSRHLFDSGPIWFAMWASNTAALRTYVKAGAKLITSKDGYRSTLSPTTSEIDGLRRDVQLYMVA